MNKRKGFTKLLSLSAAVCITFTAVSSQIDATEAKADYDGGYGYDYAGYDDTFYDGSGYDGGYDTGYDSGYDTGYDGSYDGSGATDWTDPNQTWTDPNQTWTDPNQTWTDPSQTWTDPNAGQTDWSGQNTDVTTQWTDPNAGASPETENNTDTANTTDSTAEDNENPTSPDDVYNPLSGTDISGYAEALRDIIGKQSELKVEISDADTAIREEEKMLKSIKKRTEELDNELLILNKSMTILEVQVGSNKRELERIEGQIEDGTERLKKRLRALYLSGSDSYTTVLLESDSFYDILMRMELIKRVAEHDDNIIDELYGLQEKFEIKQANLDAQQAELDKQYEMFDAKKAKLDEIYNSSAQARVLLEEKQKKLKEQEEQFNLEKRKAAEGLSSILKQPSGEVSFDEEVAANMALADAKLEELHEEIRERIRNDEEISDEEPTYVFAWPVPQCYVVNSGVGPRWGTYHTGLDIGGAHGYPIHACDAGTVIQTNTTCTHDYGKYESCNCGSGYGNFVMIDHGNDFITLYGHMSEVLVEPGDKVKQGDIIGLMGSTGFSTGDHLHLEIRYQGAILNPAYYLDVNVDVSDGEMPEISRSSDTDEDVIIVTETDPDAKNETIKVEETPKSEDDDEDKKDE